MGNTIESKGNRAYQMEERMSEPEERNIEITQEEDEKEPSFKKWRNSMRTIWFNYRKKNKNNGYPRRKRGVENRENFPN